MVELTKYISDFFSLMNLKSDSDINEVAVPKHEQCAYKSKDYLHNLEPSKAALDITFGVASHVISSIDWES